MRHSYRTINGYKAKLLRRVSNLSPNLANDITELKLPWYYIRNAAESADPSTVESADEPAAEIFIYDEIGGSFGVAAADFVQELQDIKADAITVRINSPGGSVIDAIAIYNALVQHPAHVTTRVDSMAASAASVVAMAGDVVEMMVGSQLMIHDAMGPEMGNARDHREMAKFLDDQSDNIASVYAHKGGDAQDWRAMMLAETWMFAQEAVDLGLADSIYTRTVKRELESAQPAEGSPEEESEETPEEEQQEQQEGASDEEEAKALAALMNRKHVLTNRGYKFPGRDRAPQPPSAKSKSFADLIANWR